jgi:nucleoside-diphosphate-sugar epimerase
MSSSNIVFVTGGTGTIGPALIRHLLHQGLKVRVLVRKGSDRTVLPSNVELFQGDITDREVLLRAAEGARWIFHLATRANVESPGQAVRADYVRVNVEGSRRLAHAAKEAGVGRLVFFSSISVYGSGPSSGLFTEDSPLNPTSCYAETKAEAERLLVSETATVILRLSAVYGPLVGGHYRRLLNALKKGMFLPVGPGMNRRTLVHVEDVCSAALLAANLPGIEGRIFNVTDGSVHSMKEIIEAMCLALDRPVPAMALPVGAARLAAMGFDALASMGKRTSFTGRRAIEKFIDDIAVSGAKLVREGFQPKIGLIEGWRDTVREILATSS